MKSKDLRDLSRLLSHALRHEPQTYGLTLDADGWVALGDVVNAFRSFDDRWKTVTEDDLRAITASFEKRRHEIVDGRIRATYGHSVEAAMPQAPSVPPELLYHGTSPAGAVAILRDGLRPMGRNHVHLSADRDTARQVGRRKAAAPVILTVAALGAHRAGTQFFRVDERIWVSASIAAEFVRE